MVPWCSDYHYCTTHSTKSELRFFAGSNPSLNTLEIRDGEDLRQWSQQEIMLNAFNWSKQLIRIIHLHQQKSTHEAFRIFLHRVTAA